MDLAREYPFRALSKALTAAYRAILLAAFLAMVLLSLGGRLPDFRRIVWIVTTWLVGRTLFLAVANVFETRYTAPTTPAIELVVVLGILILLGQRARFGLTRVQLPTTAPSAS
jgi:predicted permease